MKFQAALAYECFNCASTFTEADRDWDVAINTGQCPRCHKTLRDFPVFVKQQKTAPSGTSSSSGQDTAQGARSVSSAQAFGFCPHCGTKTAPSAKFCSKCGSSLEIGAQPATPQVTAASAAMPSDYEAILGEKNCIYYLTKFEQFDQQGHGLKASWNWPAFLCGGVWALYRKMYGWFFAFWGIAVLSSIFEKAGSPGLGAIIFLVPWIAFTIYANSLYHNNVKKKIAIAQLTVEDESKLHGFLRYKGGVHTWVIWVFSLVPVIGILAAILIPMFARH